MFTGKPIPFAKLGGMFADTRLGKFLAEIKNNVKKVADGVKQFFNKNFINPLREKLNGDLATPFNDINQELEFLTANNYAGLQATLPLLFSNTDPSIVSARNELLNRLGQINNLQTEYKIGPFSLGELTTLAEDSISLARQLREMEQHTDNLSGVGGGVVRFQLERITGNVTIANATVNIASSNVVTPNLSANVYPVIDIGDTIVIDTQERVVISKKFTAAPTGTVSINTTTDNTKVTTASVATLNLADCLLDSSGTIKLKSGNYISVNGEIRQVNTINALGDYLTVYLPFYNSTSGQSFLKETSFNVNSNFTSTSTDQIIKVRSSLIGNSVCLDNVITGNGTTFTSQLVPNNKIIYDNKEYIVKSVTDTTIEVEDDVLRYTVKFPISKVINEIPFLDLNEDMVDPDGILTAFTLPGQIMGDSTVLEGLTTRVRRANGVYQSVNASSPMDAAQSLFQEELIRRAKETIKQMKYDLRDDAIRSLSNTQLITAMTETRTRIENIRAEVKAIVDQDIAVLNQVKNLVKGMIKLFSMSCSKKKRKDEGGKTDSDEYLDLILQPNPERQGCNATSSDFIDILDEFDKEYNNPNVSSNNTPEIETTIPTTNFFDGIGTLTGPLPRQPTSPVGGEDTGGNIDDQDPDVTVPEDPCAKPC